MSKKKTDAEKMEKSDHIRGIKWAEVDLDMERSVCSVVKVYQDDYHTSEDLRQCHTCYNEDELGLVCSNHYYKSDHSFDFYVLPYLFVVAILSLYGFCIRDCSDLGFVGSTALAVLALFILLWIKG